MSNVTTAEQSETKGAGHTPGPWAATERGAIFSDAGHVGATFAKNWDRPSPTEIANGRLIAAAPELYEALRAVVRVADRATVEFDAARAALSKAEG
jgi:hypothetical protein